MRTVIVLPVKRVSIGVRPTETNESGVKLAGRIDAGIEEALARFGIDTRGAADGWGATLDSVYDGAIEALTSLDASFAKALAIIAEG
ncbi:hypothetical protein [Mesorhizobium sp. M0491]|uniref:hypothetical protein n=1 Tax=Mesorhizobium sp. M0491 TaxID=2956950 RepID=UPI0033376E22